MRPGLPGTPSSLAAEMLPLLRWGRVCFSTSANLGGLRLCASLERCPWAPQKEPPLRLHRIQHWQRRCSRSAPPPGHRPSGAAGAAGAGGPAFWRPCLLPPGLTAAWPPEWPRHPLRPPSRPGSGHPSGTARALGKAGLSEDKGRSPPGGAGHPHHAGHLAPWTACQVCLDLPCELVLEGRAAGPVGH